MRRILRAHRRGGALSIRVVGPDVHDVRFELSAVVTSLQVLGQTVLGFKVSIAQILASLFVAGGLDLLVVLARDHVLAWPASGLLTGNSVAFILRATGTRHGDWWSTNGLYLFVLTAAVSVASKHLLRIGGSHVFNPSNLGLVACFLIAGVDRAFPQYLWWGPLRPPVAAALVVIAAGALRVVRPLGVLPMVGAYLATLAVVVGFLALTGHGFFAIWHLGEMRGVAYVVHILASPELFVFVLFMLTDPRTIPPRGRERVVFGVLTAATSGALIGFQQSEFGVKVALLAGLTLSTAVAALLERRARIAAATAAVASLGAAAAGGTMALAADERLALVERGLAGRPQ